MAPVLDSADEAAIAADGAALAEFCGFVQVQGVAVADLEPASLARCARLATLSFLRCTAVLRAALGQPPAECTLASFQQLTHALALPSIAALVGSLRDSAEARDAVVGWLRHARAHVHAPRPALELFPPHLIALPAVFSVLALQSCEFRCPRLRVSPPVPAMCLVCGAVVCANSMCCQLPRGGSSETLGACNAHARTCAEWHGGKYVMARRCGGGLGAFVLMKQSAVVLLHGSKGCFFDSPYVDVFGEADPNMRRGKALHLSAPRYERLQALYVAHAIPDEIRRRSDRSAHVDWTHF